jgi:hypothetical protein
MKKNSGFLVGDDPATTNPSNIIYGSPNTYGVWTTEWVNGNNPPQYYFIAKVEGTSETLTSSKAVDAMVQVYESLDVVCLDVNYCANYNVKSFCDSDLCTIGGNDAPSTITCGDTLDNITGCSDHTTCGCSWNSASGKCESDWNTESRCSGENLSVGTCSYTENSHDTCEDDGMLTRSLAASWTWSPENTNMSDPLGKRAKCQNIEDVISCPASAQVSFIGTYQIIIIIAIIILAYVIYFLSKKNRSRHIKRKNKKSRKSR